MQIGEETLEALDSRIQEVIRSVKSTPMWTSFSDPSTSSELIKAIIREVYWDIYCYQPCTTRAGFSMIGRISPEEQKVMREFFCFINGMRWSIACGLSMDIRRSAAIRSVSVARRSSCRPAAEFAVAAVWERLASNLHPLAYLGAEYLFEDLTVHLAKSALELLKSRNLSVEGLHFISDHATEDVKHSALLKRAIIDVASRHPYLRPQIIFAFDCFAHVYPVELWNGSLKRACKASY